MTKYEVGQELRDNEDGSVFTILAVAPELDYDGDQCYFCKVVELIKGEWKTHFTVWDEKLFDQYTKVI